MNRDELLAKIRNDRFIKHVGIELVSTGEGVAETRLELSEKHLNGVDIVQGGVIFTLADYAFAAASNSEGTPALGLSVNISYFKPPAGRFIRAVAQEISRSNRIATYNVDVFDEDGSIVARFTGMGYRKLSAG